MNGHTCPCNSEKACIAHAETLYMEPDEMSNSWNEAKDIAINNEIAKLAKIDCREVYTDDRLSDSDMAFLDKLEMCYLFQ